MAEQGHAVLQRLRHSGKQSVIQRLRCSFNLHRLKFVAVLPSVTSVLELIIGHRTVGYASLRKKGHDSLASMTLSPSNGDEVYCCSL